MFSTYIRPFVLFFLMLIPLYILSVAVNKGYKHNKFRINHQIQQEEIQKIEKDNPDIVLMGNSMLGRGINIKFLNKLLDNKCYMFEIPGSKSATWYLMLKNVIAKASPTPKTIILFFRDDYLTRPKLATTKQVKFKVENYMTEHEPVLKQLVYSDISDNFEGKLPLYKYKHYLQNDMEKTQKQLFLPFVDIEHCILSSYGIHALNLAKKADSSLQNTKMLGEVINFSFNSDKEKVLEDGGANIKKKDTIALKYLTTARELLNFENQINKSLFPHIIDIAKEKNIKMVLVRVKNRHFADGQKQSKIFDQYMKDLNVYLEKHNVTLIDYTTFSKLKPIHYADGDHLNPTGRVIFTKQLATDLENKLNIPLKRK